MRYTIEQLIEQELVKANSKFPLFCSGHEWYAVTLEEVQEALYEQESISRHLASAWGLIKQNKSPDTYVRFIKACAINSILESIQVAAMCDKYAMSRKQWHSPMKAGGWIEVDDIRNPLMMRRDANGNDDCVANEGLLEEVSCAEGADSNDTADYRGHEGSDS